MGLKDLLEFLINWIEGWFFVIIPQYERGVRMRNGKFKEVLEPGFHWKIPIIDTVLTHMIVTTTLNISEQSVTTKDWKSVVVASVVKYDVSDIETFLLTVGDQIDALSDMTKGIIRKQIMKREWKDCNSSTLLTDIKNEVKEKAQEWGINVIEVTLTDLGEMRSFRLFNSTFLQT